MKQIYLIPAPDMDERAIEAVSLEGVEFIRIKLPKLTRHSIVKEVISQLTSQIEQPRPIILGFCYGGVLAVELGKQIEVEKIIVVSGVKNSREVIFSRKVLAASFCVVPELALRAVGLTAAFLLNRVIRLDVKIPRLWAKADQNRFIVKHALNFDCRETKGEIVRIHGSRDRVVPLGSSIAEYLIEDGGHFMFIHRRKEVLQAIGQAIFATGKN